MRFTLPAFCLLVAACGGAGSPSPPPPDAGSASQLVAARPYNVKVPQGYNASTPTPLVLLLHGYGVNGAVQNVYFGTPALADARNFLLAYPDGTPDSLGNRYWNATDACCGSGVDDVAYLTAVLDDMQSKYNVDPKRIFVMGHSNGGFMAYRLACDRSTRIAGIASFAGAMWKDPSQCRPSQPVAVLQVHGDLDAVISYNGGVIGTTAYPSAHETVADWAMFNGCTGSLTPTGTSLDLLPAVEGAETREERYDGCRGNGAVELWTMAGGTHVPLPIVSDWAGNLYDFLSAHPKP
jgi:polyhydroxybutyrate depolymerase